MPSNLPGLANRISVNPTPGREGEAAMSGKLYIICDENNNVMNFQGVRMFGIAVTIPAMFAKESEALEVLFKVEESGATTVPHMVRVINASVTAQDAPYESEVVHGGH